MTHCNFFISKILNSEYTFDESRVYSKFNILLCFFEFNSQSFELGAGKHGYS